MHVYFCNDLAGGSSFFIGCKLTVHTCGQGALITNVSINQWLEGELKLTRVMTRMTSQKCDAETSADPRTATRVPRCLTRLSWPKLSLFLRVLSLSGSFPPSIFSLFFLSSSLFSPENSTKAGKAVNAVSFKRLQREGIFQLASFSGRWITG